MGFLIFQGISHSISSILTYYESQTDISIKSYTRFKLKKIRKKNISALRMTEPATWMSRHLHWRVPLAAVMCPTRQLHWRNPSKK